ncbi:MAG: CoA pyrophosphatase, partial [Thermoanaerobaculia bacterium]
MIRFDDDTAERLEALLATRPADEMSVGKLRRACVVAPLIPRRDGWSLLFVRRSESLALHRGQVAFPGGAAEAGETLEETAVRETEEEVGIPRDAIRLIGRLDDLHARTGFIVAPFIGIIPPDLEYVLQESEVVETYEVPISVLLSPPNPE